MPYDLRDDIKIELDGLIITGRLQILDTIEEDYFVSPVVITVKKETNPSKSC